jgi:hypothetical protein
MTNTDAGNTLKDVVINGTTITYDEAKTKSWGAFKLFKRLRELQKQREESEDGAALNDMDVLDALFGLIEHATGMTPDDVAELCGGADASMADVISFANQIISEVYSKN